MWSLETRQTAAPAHQERICAVQEPRSRHSVKRARSILVGAVAAPRNDLTFAEGIGLAYCIAAILAADAEEVGGLEAPILVGSAYLRGGLAVCQIRQRHLGGLGKDNVGRDADHGADGTKSNMYEVAPDSVILIMPTGGGGSE